MTRIDDHDAKGRFSTRAIHAGQRPDPLSGAIMPPIYQTSTYVHDGFGKHKGYEYARGRNPTREALERNVAALEGGRHGFAFSSGMGCVDSLMKLFKAGDHIVVGEDAYGGLFRLFDKILSNFGVAFTFVDTRDLQRVADAMTPKTVAVFAETPTNPLMRLTDIRGVAEIARRGNALLIVDNTFASPYFQNPLGLGADVVFHSTTKYLNGHSDIIGGICVCNDDQLAERIWFIANASGAVPGPFDCWLALRGTKTLAVRMKAHDANGRKLSAWLAERLGQENVFYPGLESHPQHKLADRQMTGYGGMLSAELGSLPTAGKFLENLRVFSLAESLGGVESLANHPATMTHASVPADRRKMLGITDGIIRLSIGIEDGEDLLEDLDQALKAAGR
jgi:cystathionine beta-lyase/cystathionine gamma-synthase